MYWFEVVVSTQNRFELQTKLCYPDGCQIRQPDQWFLNQNNISGKNDKHRIVGSHGEQCTLLQYNAALFIWSRCIVRGFTNQYHAKTSWMNWWCFCLPLLVLTLAWDTVSCNQQASAASLNANLRKWSFFLQTPSIPRGTSHPGLWLVVRSTCVPNSVTLP